MNKQGSRHTGPAVARASVRSYSTAEVCFPPYRDLNGTIDIHLPEVSLLPLWENWMWAKALEPSLLTMVPLKVQGQEMVHVLGFVAVVPALDAKLHA